MKKNQRVLFHSNCAKSFFVYYFVGSLLVLACAFAFKYMSGDELLLKNILIALGSMTVIVSTVAPIYFLRHIEINEERIIVKWSVLNMQKSIPLCLISKFEKSNFLATPAIKVKMKNGSYQKIPFVDRRDELVKTMTPDKFPCNQVKSEHFKKAV